MVVRYRLPAGSTPPLTDVVGHLEQVQPTLLVRTKRGDAVTVAIDDVVAIKALAAKPTRASDIRALEHAAALGWPGTEQQWIDGWLLRYGDGVTRRANSALPLRQEADASAMPAIVEWYTARGVAPLLAAADRLFPIPARVPTDAENLVLVRDLADFTESPSGVALAARPDEQWLRTYERRVPVDVLSAVVDGDVVFATIGDVAVARAAVTAAPDGTRWVGLSALRVGDEHRRRGHARNVCAALLRWGADQGATRAYTQVVVENTSAATLFESMGFTVHHRSRYVRADAVQNGGGS